MAPSMRSVNDSEYPLTILAGRKEEISFEIKGDGKNEIWSGEFSFEGPTANQFEQYQTAWTDAGFEIEEMDDTENMQSIEFTNYWRKRMDR